LLIEWLHLVLRKVKVAAVGVVMPSYPRPHEAILLKGAKILRGALPFGRILSKAVKILPDQ